MPFEDHPLPAAFHVEPIVPRKPGRGGNHPPRKKKGAINKLTRDVKGRNSGRRYRTTARMAKALAV